LVYEVIPELLDRHYNCKNLDDMLVNVIAHVRWFEQTRWNFPHTEAPPPFECDHFSIIFMPKSKETTTAPYFFQPVSTEEIAKHLLGPGGKGRNGENMVPMVQKAIDKGADYLMYRVTSWGDWAHIVEDCFSDTVQAQGATYFSSDPRLGSLSGVILFARYDHFCIINNSQSDAKNWISA